MKWIEEFSCVTDDYEVVSVLHARTVYSVFYHPLHGNPDCFFQFLQGLFVCTSDFQYNIICGGDFNIDLCADTGVRREFELLFHSYDCLNVIHGPARVTSDTSTCLDLFITNCVWPG